MFLPDEGIRGIIRDFVCALTKSKKIWEQRELCIASAHNISRRKHHVERLSHVK